MDAARGRELSKLDGTRPRVIGVYADGDFGSFDTLAFWLSEPIDAFKASEHSCFLIDGAGNVVIPTFQGSGIFGDVLDFFFIPGYAHCNLFRINLSNAVFDLSGEPLDLMSPCTCLVDCPGP